MTAAEAKQIPIVDILAAMRRNPAKMNEKEAWYISPWRKEKTPSFSVLLRKNIWYDHGEGVGGTAIDLVCRLHRCTVAEALRILSSFSFSPAPPPSADKEEIKIASIKALSNPALVEYITVDRGIDRDIADKYIREIYWTKSDRRLFAIAFSNDCGGWETRNKIMKGNIGGKSITTICGSSGSNVAIFEGFIDFLSVATHHRIMVPRDDIIVLNSISMISDELLEKLKRYKGIKLFLDLDDAGRTATKKIISELGGGGNCKDWSMMYRGYKDANEWLLAKKLKANFLCKEK